MFIVCITAPRFDNRDGFAGYATYPAHGLPGFVDLDAARDAAATVAEYHNDDPDLAVTVRQVVNGRLVALPKAAPVACDLWDDIEF